MRARDLALLALVSCSEDLTLPPVPVVIPPGGGCLTDSDCAHGICDANHVCQATGCRIDSDCQYGLCESNNTCNPNLCRVDSQCQSGHCASSGSCVVPQCAMDSDCDAGEICNDFGGFIQCIVGCHYQYQCAGCAVCSSGDGGRGFCNPQVGPALHGSRTAMRMTDNLATAVAYAQQQSAGAALVLITGSELKADGTVDVTLSYNSEWLYGFVVGDGGNEKLSITFGSWTGAGCGAYQAAAGNISPSAPMPAAQWQRFIDATTLVTTFETHPNCHPPSQMIGDGITYTENGSAPQFSFSTAPGQGWLGDPTSLDAGLIYCP